MADYPSSIKQFTTKVDYEDVIYAENVNTLQDEVKAIQTALGTGVLTNSQFNGTFTTSSNNGSKWATLSDRLANIEYALTSDVHTHYLKLAGGSTVTAGAATTVGATIKGAASQSADLLRFQNSSGTTLTRVASNGDIYVGADKVAVGSVLNPMLLIGS